MKKPVIGITPLVDYEKESYWMLPGYMNGIIEAGGNPIMLPLTEDAGMISQLLDHCDGILIAGGQDVSPVLYGEEELPCCKECSPERDRMELILLDEALSRDIPVFGICRGLQFINAALGGTLYQDLPTQHPSDIVHVMTKPYDAAAHQVTVLKDSPLWDLLRPDNCINEFSIGVNSLHHQAIRDPAPDLKVMALSEDGLAEAVDLPAKTFVRAVQWHPEFSYKVNEDSRKLFRSFVRAAELYQKEGKS
jgi:putative glutamine amidotransferase